MLSSGMKLGNIPLTSCHCIVYWLRPLSSLATTSLLMLTPFPVELDIGFPRRLFPSCHSVYWGSIPFTGKKFNKETVSGIQ